MRFWIVFLLDFSCFLVLKLIEFLMKIKPHRRIKAKRLPAAILVNPSESWRILANPSES